MKRLLAFLFLAIVLVAAWWLFFRTEKPSGDNGNEQQSALVVKKHSASFNTEIERLIDSYMQLKDAFVNADSALAKEKSAQLVSVADSLSLDELSDSDTQLLAAARQQLSDIRANAAPISEENDLTSMRQDFRMVSENMYPFLKTIGYEGDKLYWQNCPMAFGDQEANWLSTTSEIVNPYLGKNHPEFKSSMLHCGEVKDSIFLR